MSNVLKQKWVMLFLICSVVVALVIVSFKGNEQADAASTSFRFVVMGDSRGASDGINETTLRSLLSEVQDLSVQPEFIFFTGDQVMGGSDVEQELDDWSNIVDDYFPLNKFYPSLGNHEDDETIFSNAFTHLPSNQLSGYQRTAYYFDYGNARFITLNSDRKDNRGNYIIDSSQRAWLESVLHNNGKTHNFVQFHVPAYPIGAHYGRSLDENSIERDALWDIFDKYNVTAVMTGHEHNYNRREIDSSFNNNGYTFENNINQLTIGGAGAPLSSTVRDSKNVDVGPLSSYHYMVVDVVDEVAEFKLYDINSNLLDSFTVNRDADSAPPSSTTTTEFQNGVHPTSAYDGMIDSYLSENDSTSNFGSEITLLVDGDDPSNSNEDKYAILKWDTSTIPSKSDVVSASITIDVTDASSSSFELYELKRDWSEAQVTWEESKNGSNWEVAGADGSSDRGASILGTITANSTGSHTIELNTTGISVVQAWIDNPLSNHGIVISHPSHRNGIDIRSSEATNVSERPKLTIVYE
ncbi:DNRLRE domain-containing protein [Bacillus spongiae]|uniref:DNRLRE domain-containing protein n=1 Tax=Bacillus spongiae TaxID=2683610 RepID=A0ABU8HGV8_9BACI